LFFTPPQPSPQEREFFSFGFSSRCLWLVSVVELLAAFFLPLLVSERSQDTTCGSILKVCNFLKQKIFTTFAAYYLTNMNKTSCANNGIEYPADMSNLLIYITLKALVKFV
jgi:hypothetical protein